MTNLFLTGDRSMNPMLALPLAASALANFALQGVMDGESVNVGTGDNGGFEEAVRQYCATLGIPVHVIPTGTDPDTEKPAWDTRHEVVGAWADLVTFAHTDPLGSSIGKSAMKVLGDKVQMLV